MFITTESWALGPESSLNSPKANRTQAKILGANLRHYRIQKGVSQQQLVKDLEISSQPTYSSWETGRTEPPMEWLIKLADYHGITVDVLVGKKKPPIKTKTPKVRLASNLAYYRNLKRVSQAQLVTDLRIGAQPTYSSWERGRTEPPIEWLIKLADYHGITTDELIRGIPPGLSILPSRSSEIADYEILYSVYPSAQGHLLGSKENLQRFWKLLHRSIRKGTMLTKKEKKEHKTSLITIPLYVIQAPIGEHCSGVLLFNRQKNVAIIGIDNKLPDEERERILSRNLETLRTLISLRRSSKDVGLVEYEVIEAFPRELSALETGL